jgi:ABC-type uncharacterized transport system auxiliary subunit
MMRLTRYAITFAGIALLLSACGGSRPVKYYVLDVAPPPAGSAQPLPVTLLVGRIATTQLYRADRLVYGSGPVLLGTYEYERWAESPADMIQDILISSLRASGQYRSVSRMTSSMRADYVVRGRLFGLYDVEDKSQIAARFSMQLDLFDPKSGMTVWSGNYSHDEPVSGKKVSDVVEALDKNVRGGIQQLTTDMSGYVSTHLPAAAH